MEFKIQHFDSLSSTNDSAVELVMKGQAKEGLVLVTSEQTKGKGHGSNRWESARGKNLTLSVILEPRFLEASDQFFLTKIVSLALQETLQKYLPEHTIRIKWPNDLYCGDKKMAGVLIQNFLKGAMIEYTVIGVGLNVNQEEFVSDAPNPVSMKQCTHQDIDLTELRDEWLQILGFYYHELQTEEGRNVISSQYMNHLYRYRTVTKYQDSNGIFWGEIVDINSFGQLIIQDESGNRRTYDFKEVAFR
ncbi:MAG: biotin--[acetyl-CoA-carboxylase] ligase [Bacteroidales bacterium]|nr:biotin--[acetyl-CoA-carboxylase] ligase [Bacteroidales bacterium]